MLPSSVDVPEQTGIIQVLSEDPELSTFLSLISKYPTIIEILSRDVPLTVFAPVNSAFDGLVLPAYASEENVLLYHIGGQQLTQQNLIDFTLLNVPTFLGEGLDSTFNSAGDVFVEDAQIIEADIVATNGIIQKIDGVLIPANPADLLRCRYPGFFCDFIEEVADLVIDNFREEITQTFNDVFDDVVSIFFP